MRPLLLLMAVAAVLSAAEDPLLPYLGRSAPRIVRELKPDTNPAGLIVRRVVFASQTTGEVYAVIAAPDAAGAHPGLLIFHGGTGSAAETQAIAWARHGYIAIAPDLPGIAEPKSAPHSTGAWKSLKYGDGRWIATPDVKASVIFDAVVVGIESLRLLQAQPNIDKAHIGVMGISWGGYMTTMVAALAGSDVRAAFSIFGCGFYELTSMGADGPLAKMAKEQREQWIRWLDPGLRAANIRAPYFIASGTNDFFFWPPAVMATLNAIPGEKNHVFAPNANHKIPTPGGTETGLKDHWTAMELAYFDHYLKGVGKPFASVTPLPSPAARTVGFKVLSPEPVSSVEVYTSEIGAWLDRKWTSAPVRAIGNGEYEAALPAEAAQWFASVTDTRSIATSSDMIATSKLTPLADPFVGVDAGGNTVPGAAVPFGFVELSPDTTDADTSGYASTGRIIGFSHTHVSGTGGESKYGNFRVTPTAGPLRVGNLRFSKSQESASPGYYAVTLAGDGGNIRCAATATRLSGIERFIFPAGKPANILIDVSSHSKLAQRATHVEVNIVDDRHVSGTASFTGGWNPGPYTLHFWAEFSRPAKSAGAWTAGPGGASVTRERTLSGTEDRPGTERLGAWAIFDTGTDQTVEVRLGVSFLSVENARRNLETETAGQDFDSIRRRADQAWEDVLEKIKVDGGTETQRRSFYSALYRAHYMPHDLTGENVWWPSAEPHYEDFYTIWDTFRTLHPLFTLIQPDRQRDMVRSLIDTYRHTGWLPDARIAGSNGMTQGGSNGDVLIADAIVKGLSGIDYETAYQALVKDANVESKRPLNEGRELADYLKLGYMSLTYPRSASRTLEYAYDDFAISQVADKLGKTADAAKYRRRSENWSLLWDPQLKCIRPRYADGSWMENFDCAHEYPDLTTEWWDAPFYEGRAIQYSTYVPHDVNGLIQRVGGDAAFTSWLDTFFDQRLYTHGNEPDLLAPWLYIHAGRPDRTALRVRRILEGEYKDTRDGLPGNDDAGTLSSWYVWAAIGLYPNAGQPYYYIGSPIFTRAELDLGGGKRFVISAPAASPANTYVERAELNGQRLDRAWLKHEEIAAGGTLVLHMAPSPSTWGRTNRPWKP